MSPRRRSNTVPAGRDTFHIVGPGGETPHVKPEASHALNIAQRLAEATCEPVTLYVERRSVLGPKATLYRVDRDEDGTVVTTTISRED